MTLNFGVELPLVEEDRSLGVTVPDVLGVLQPGRLFDMIPVLVRSSTAGVHDVSVPSCYSDRE